MKLWISGENSPSLLVGHGRLHNLCSCHTGSHTRCIRYAHARSHTIFHCLLRMNRSKKYVLIDLVTCSGAPRKKSLAWVRNWTNFRQFSGIRLSYAQNSVVFITSVKQNSMFWAFWMLFMFCCIFGTLSDVSDVFAFFWMLFDVFGQRYPPSRLI